MTIQELLNRAEEFEVKIEQYYARIRDETDNNGVKLLTYYLARHRRHAERVLADFDDKIISHVEKVQLKYDVALSPAEEFGLFDADPASIGSEQLLDTAVAYDAALIGLYKSVLNQPIEAVP